MLVNLSDDFVVQLIKLADELNGNKLKKLLLSKSWRFFGERACSYRITNCLESIGANKVIDVVNLTEDDLSKVKNLGRRSIWSIKQALKGAGLSLDMNIKAEIYK